SALDPKSAYASPSILPVHGPSAVTHTPLASIVASIPWKPIFQRLPGTWLLLLLPFAVLGPAHAPVAYALYYTVLHLLFFANNCRSAYATRIAFNEARLTSTTDWSGKYAEEAEKSKMESSSASAESAEEGLVKPPRARFDLPFDHVVHIIVLPNYKEDMDTLCETLDVLASHSRAVSQYKICLAMEESEAGCEDKARTLMKLYGASFYDLTYSVHPMNRPDEIRGKSSNVAWAVSDMISRSTGATNDGEAFHGHEIVTVMDADTCFAEDYFTSVTYHYAVATPEERKVMMFAPSTVFDRFVVLDVGELTSEIYRNANNVPVFVRVTDMFWSIGVISNLYRSSPVKLPCSAYSVSVDLVNAVGSWDAGPEAIGEDLHMYLKCFFCTEGRLIVKPIFSPASQCNVEGAGEAGWRRWVSCIGARYTQAKRHLWGSLDTGYSLRRALLGIVAPEYDRVNPSGKGPTTTGSRASVDPFQTGLDLGALMSLFHRLLEAHILMGHFFVLVLVSALTIPIASALYAPLAAILWSAISTTPEVHPYVELAVGAGFWIKLACVIPNVITFYYYERYHRWVGFERWALQEDAGQAAGVEAVMVEEGERAQAKSIIDPLHPQHRGAHSRAATCSDRSAGEAVLRLAGLTVAAEHRGLRVQHLGRRPTLASARLWPLSCLDWVTVPVSGLLFYVAPQFEAQLTQLWTDKLVYKVAAKPALPGGGAAGVAMRGILVSDGDVKRATLYTAGVVDSVEEMLEVKVGGVAAAAAASVACRPVGAVVKSSGGVAYEFAGHTHTPAGVKLVITGAEYGDADTRSCSSSRGDEGYFEEEEIAGELAPFVGGDKVDWFDGHAQLTRQYQLFFYPVDSTIEMVERLSSGEFRSINIPPQYDVKQRRTFLKRTSSHLRLEDLHVGAAVNVYARQLTIRSYGDEYTSRSLDKQMERCDLSPF
ncbi:hypothetical protein HK101_009214, partial [Irineochytrium annulatum]